MPRGSVAVLALALAGCNALPTREAPCANVQAELRTLEAAIQLHDVQTGTALPEAGWHAALVGQKLIDPATPSQDAWGHAFVYARVGTRFELTSVGPDGILHTSDDQTTSGGYRWTTCRSGKGLGGCSFRP